MGPRTCGQAGGHGCSGQLDPLGDHLAACPRTGHLPRRANPIERAWTRIAREAGARVAHKQLLRDTNVPISNQMDQRQLDLVIYGVDPQGLPLCCDATMVAALDRRGRPIPRAANHDGAALARAHRRKERRHPELLGSPYGKLVVLACEVGGRWSKACLTLVARLAKEKARNAPALLRQSARAAWLSRWWGLLSVASQSALAATLGGASAQALGGPPVEDDVPLGDVLTGTFAECPSRLPLRS